MTTTQVFDPGQIKTLLSYHNVSQNQLAIYAGYSRTYVQRCLSGEQKPSQQAAENITRAVNELTGSRTFDYREMEVLTRLLSVHDNMIHTVDDYEYRNRSPNMTDREWQQFLEKLQ